MFSSRFLESTYQLVEEVSRRRKTFSMFKILNYVTTTQSFKAIRLPDIFLGQHSTSFKIIKPFEVAEKT